MRLGGNCGVGGGLGTCVRMRCRSTSAAYLCAESSSSVTKSCAEIANKLTRIFENCCDYSSGISGHRYHLDENPKYSVWIGYGNCNHPVTRGPSTYPYPGGSPNGLCNPL